MPNSIRLIAAMFIGLALSTANPFGIAAAIAMPALALLQTSRRRSFWTAAGYYGAAVWPVIPGAKNFFGPQVSWAEGLCLWAFASTVLALPWVALWSSRRKQILWRAPLALAISVLPPFGIIGWASPLTGAGYLFPGTGWWGILACIAAMGTLTVSRRLTITVLGLTSTTANLIYPGDPPPPLGWQAISTNFGDIAHSAPAAMAEYKTAQAIQQQALVSTASVIVFPETVVPNWTDTTDDFWKSTLEILRLQGKTILVGARIPLRNTINPNPAYQDFATPLSALETGHSIARAEPREPAAFTGRYLNAVIVRGAETAVLHQRVPVPLAMWNPLTGNGAPLNLAGSGVRDLGNQKAALLICYEQLIPWPFLQSMVEGPTLIVAVANDHWATSTPIPQLQLANVRAWARLFSLPNIFAGNL